MPETATKSALVVDDDPQVSALVGRWLRRAGFDVTTCETFEDAKRRVIDGQSLSALIVDVRLGGFNGLHLAIFARQQWPATRIVVLSGWDDAALRREANACGAVYLLKPLNAEDVLGAIDSAGPANTRPATHANPITS